MTDKKTVEQMQEVLKESGLEPIHAQDLMGQFETFFEIAADWAGKAKAIVVTDASQVTEMAKARTGRLFLRTKRIGVENTRKKLKEKALREGQAIDRIARTLRDLIEPIEQHLEQQEKFVELKMAAEMQLKREEEEAQAEVDQLAAIEAEQIEQARIVQENAVLRNQLAKKEAAERRKRTLLLAERAKVAKAEAATAAAEQEKREALQDVADKKLAAERKEAAAKKAKHDAELKIAQDAKDRLEAELAAMITCPKCGHTFVKEE